MKKIKFSENHVKIFNSEYYRHRNGSWIINSQKTPARTEGMLRFLEGCVKSTFEQGILGQVDHLRINSEQACTMYLQGTISPQTLEAAKLLTDASVKFWEVEMIIANRDFKIRIYKSAEDTNYGPFNKNGVDLTF